MRPRAAVWLVALLPLAAPAQETSGDGEITVAPLSEPPADQRGGEGDAQGAQPKDDRGRTPPGLARPPGPDTAPARRDVAQASGAVLRMLDRRENRTRDRTLEAGQKVTFGNLDIRLGECRAPVDNPEGDAFAYLTVTEAGGPADPAFSGWMIASSPALNALEHPRYDVWVLRCTNASGDGVAGDRNAASADSASDSAAR